MSIQNDVGCIFDVHVYLAARNPPFLRGDPSLLLLDQAEVVVFGIWLAVYDYAEEEAPKGAAPYGAVCSLFRRYPYVFKSFSGCFDNFLENSLHDLRKRILVLPGDDKGIMNGERDDSLPVHLRQNLTADFGIYVLES